MKVSVEGHPLLIYFDHFNRGVLILVDEGQVAVSALLDVISVTKQRRPICRCQLRPALLDPG